MLSKHPVMTTIPCTDLDKCKDFYENVLGLEPVMGAPSESIMYDCAGTRILLYKTDAPKGGQTVCSFVVPDIDSEMAELRDKGVHFEEYDLPATHTEHGIASDPSGARSCWIKDPEGNILSITELRAQAMAA